MAWLVEAGTTEVYRKEIEKTQLGFIWEIWQELDIRNSRYCSIRMFIDNHTDSWSMCPSVITTDYQYNTVKPACWTE